MRTPRVSVITIFLDAAPFIADAIASVRGQTLADWELLLVDDGSTDGSSDIARAAAADDERIRYLHHPDRGNHGMSASRNVGLCAAHGDVVALLDADDVYLPERLQHHVDLLDGEPSADMVYGPQTLWWSWQPGVEVRRDWTYPTHEPVGRLIRPPRLFHDFLLGWAPTPATCCVTVRREALEAVGGFETPFTGMFEDQVAFLKLGLHGTALVTDRALDRYRKHDASATAQAIASGEWSTTDPNNPSQESLLTWLEGYLTAIDVEHVPAARRSTRRYRLRQRTDGVRFVGGAHRRLVQASRKLRRRYVARRNDRRRG